MLRVPFEGDDDSAAMIESPSGSSSFSSTPGLLTESVSPWTTV